MALRQFPTATEPQISNPFDGNPELIRFYAEIRERLFPVTPTDVPLDQVLTIFMHTNLETRKVMVSTAEPPTYFLRVMYDGSLLDIDLAVETIRVSRAGEMFPTAIILAQSQFPRVAVGAALAGIQVATRRRPDSSWRLTTCSLSTGAEAEHTTQECRMTA